VIEIVIAAMVCSAGLEARLYVSQDGRRYGFHSRSFRDRPIWPGNDCF
jgi:hypothetical protein